MSVDLTRRTASLGLGATAIALSAPTIARAAKPKVVVIGGGFGGAEAARALVAGGAEVTLVEPNETYVSCPFSNEVIIGMRPMERQTFGYDGVKATGVTIARTTATGIDAEKKTVALESGGPLPFDRLVLSPGIEIRYGALPGYDEAASKILPHAWKAGEQTLLLKSQLEAMDDGGVVVMSAPANPFRCPPGPYERASLIAHFLKTKKPKSKLILLDAKDKFSKQPLFEAAWKELYSGVLEFVPLSAGGQVTEVDAKEKTFKTDFETYKAAVGNVIPSQRAGKIAVDAGCADKSGWCPIDPVTFESKLVPGLHVIGDAAIAGAMPKSAFSANAQAKVCAEAVLALIAGGKPQEPRLINTCYSLVAPGYGISIAGVFKPSNGLLADVEGAGGISQLNAPKEIREAEAKYAEGWYDVITKATFG